MLEAVFSSDQFPEDYLQTQGIRTDSSGGPPGAQTAMFFGHKSRLTAHFIVL